MPFWLKQLASYIATFTIYTLLTSWKVSIVLTVGVGLHECGHLLAARSMGMKTRGFWLIPFMGGAAIIADRYRRYSHQAFVALAGPIAGMLVTVVCYVVFLATDSPIWGSAAYWMGWLNLFNLLPLSIMDGGQLIESIAFSLNELFGVIFSSLTVLIGAVVLWQFNPVISILIFFLGGRVAKYHYNAYKLRKEGLGQFIEAKPQRMNPLQLWAAGFSYVATAGLLWLLISLPPIFTHDLSNFLHSK